MPEPVRSTRRLDLLYGAHLALVLVLVTGRLLRAGESSFTASSAGRAIALLAMVAGIPALLAVLLSTIRARRDPKALFLFVLLACALYSRKGPDVFDVLYALGALALAVLWFSRGRRSGAAGRGLEGESV